LNCAENTKIPQFTAKIKATKSS